MKTPHRHQSHPAIVNRLKRARGHLEKVISMIESGEDCLALAQQLQAVESAVANAKTTLIEDHLDHCLDDVVGPLDAEKRRGIDELKKIAKYL
ncbi:metal-sensing transcriptional repressor [Hoeflea poritis]|uniref:Metal-sensing transcriptional repressor n=1 Tax=Hoeflea poritis TaxID=2993659 RepID=A0ABT4VU89_9HYPH|nr:metal-sensing transcriptional repressor [Hoeflea poritis]MDA4848284.1 metal-sensing transcriptional repressor [Hoeflea poritis]